MKSGLIGDLGKQALALTGGRSDVAAFARPLDERGTVGSSGQHPLHHHDDPAGPGDGTGRRRRVPATVLTMIVCTIDIVIRNVLLA
jgi:hypothetical protein